MEQHGLTAHDANVSFCENDDELLPFNQTSDLDGTKRRRCVIASSFANFSTRRVQHLGVLDTQEVSLEVRLGLWLGKILGTAATRSSVQRSCRRSMRWFQGHKFF